jgi:cobalamin-independent methionine synthase catalytic subunit
MSFPWEPGSATGIGSLPGTDIVEALRYVFGELPLPYLPELPARGPGADLIGRTAGLLVDLPVQLYAGRWQVADRAGRDLRRTADLWERDLDALTDVADGYTGPLKVPAAGPLSLAAALQLPLGGPMLSDPGAVRELSESLAEGLSVHVAEITRRVPGARVILQLDEPTLPAVLAGRVPTESGLRTLRALDTSVARDRLRLVVASAGVPVVVHCCAPDVPVPLLREAGTVGVALDLSLNPPLDPLGEALDAGYGLFAGACPAVGPPPPSASVAATVTDLWHKIGLPAERLAEQVVITPACGQAGASPADARAALKTCREAAQRIREA